MHSADLVIIATGQDATEFHLHGNLPSGRRRGAEGVILQTIDGMAGPPMELRRRAAARQEGSTAGTKKVSERIVGMTVALTATRSHSIDEVWERWRRLWDNPVRLVCHSRKGVRWVEVQLAKEMVFASEIDPHKRGVYQIDMSLVAPDPYAYSAAYVEDQVMGSTHSANFTMANPTDVDCWPRFITSAGGQGWAIPDGVGEVKRSVLLDKIDGPFSADTNPLKPTITAASGEPHWGVLVGRGFTQPVPAGTPPTPRKVMGPSGSSCRMIMERRWQTPW